MTGRIRMALGDGAAPHWTGTFHGLGARQLRIEPEVADLRPGFDILDADDTRRMIKRVMKSMNLASGDDEGGSVRRPSEAGLQPYQQVERRTHHASRRARRGGAPDRTGQCRSVRGRSTRPARSGPGLR